jgi:hypothetical protein
MPEGNSFPRQAELDRALEQAGFEVREQVAAPSEIPRSWTERADRVDELVRSAHGQDEAYLEAQEQSRRIGVLLDSGQVFTQLVHAVGRRL